MAVYPHYIGILSYRIHYIVHPYYRHIVPVSWSVEVPHGCMHMFRVKSAVKETEWIWFFMLILAHLFYVFHFFEVMKIYLIDSSSLSSLSSLLGITIFSLLCLFFSFLYIQILSNKFGKYSRSLFLNTESSTVAVQQNNESLFWVLFYSENLFFPMMLLILFRNYIYFSSNFLTLISKDMH